MKTYLQLHTDAIYKAYHEYEKALAHLQATCEHKVILEADRQSQTYFRDLPYMRVCEDCGVEEESAWGINWKILTGRAYPTKRDGKDGLYSRRPMKTYIPEEDRERLGYGNVSQDSNPV